MKFYIIYIARQFILIGSYDKDSPPHFLLLYMILFSTQSYGRQVDCYLYISSLQNVDHKMKYKSKKGQLPFVEVNGEEVADSAIIIKELGTRYNCDLDAALSAEQRNVAHATVSMIENHFAW